MDGSLRRRKPAGRDERRRQLWSSLCESLRGHQPEAVRRVLARVYPGLRFHELDIAAIAEGLRVPFDEAIAAALNPQSRRAG